MKLHQNVLSYCLHFKFGESIYLNTDSICSASLIQFKEQYAAIVSSDPVESKKILGGTYILVYPFHLGIDNRNSATIECGNELQFQFDINLTFLGPGTQTAKRQWAGPGPGPCHSFGAWAPVPQTVKMI